MNHCCFGACGVTKDVRRLKILIGDDELRLQPDFCEEHVDQLMIRLSTLIGEMLVGKAAPF